MVPVVLVTLVQFATTCGDAVILAAATLAFVTPVAGDVTVVFQAFEAGIHGGFFKFVCLARALVHQFGDFVAILIAIFQKLQDDGVGVAAKEV